jgi:hypothetical protein
MKPGELCCWPSVPERCDAPRAEQLESYWAGVDPAEVFDVEVGQDDIVVFGLPLGIVEHVAGKLVEGNERWKLMVEHMATTATQAMQLWVRRPASELGWWEDAVVGGYDGPYDTFSDMPELVHQERVEGAATVLYLCSVLEDGPDGEHPAPDDDVHEWVARRRLAVDRNAREFETRRAGRLWPGAVDPASDRLDEGIVIDTFVRGNFQPSDRYVLSIPNSVRFRLDPGDTGYDNLVVAGDWTRCIINAGCVEAATISGMLAAEAVLARLEGTPPTRLPIIGR